MTVSIGRRELLVAVGGVAAAWPLAARAQQRERMRRIGVLLPATPDDARYQTWAGAFLQELANSGWSIGRNARIDTRWATANADAVRKQAAELVALAPDVILATGTSTVGPLLRLTRHQFSRIFASLLGIEFGPPSFDPYIASGDPARLREPLQERPDPGLIFRIVRG